MVSQLLHRELGLTDDEYEALRDRIGREPNPTELAVFSVMWSEHCSYKSSRIHLRRLPSEGPAVLVGPGEGAGVVEVAPGEAVAWKIESHNHPSFVEPFNGAATGVGGIVRDVLSMGARPIALLDSLRFGPPDDGRTRYLVDGVVAGISSYGNAIGVATVGGELCFEDCYAANPLVNVACLGVIEHGIMNGRAEGPGNAIVLYGSSTGRDGIGGASVLASATFGEDSAGKRPSVQVGDPLSEKLVIEATLELVARGLIVGLQDLGAGGLSCPSSEMAAKAGTGVRLDLDRVHLREPGMEPLEIMISESQERMAAVVAPERAAEVVEVCRRWGLEARVVGEVTSTGRLEADHAGVREADLPVEALADGGPVYDRPSFPPAWLGALQAADPGAGPPSDLEEAFRALLGSPALASKRWVWEQYDHMIGLGTIVGPGADAAVIRLPGSRTAVALSLDGPGRLCYLDPYEGARLAVAEAARNVACTGARPVAVTNCLNLGNPERAEVMWQLAEVTRGLADACRALGTPVVGGNVSLYNETGGRAIYPTPTVGMLGVLAAGERAVGASFARPGDALVLLGATRAGDFGGSEYSKVVNATVAGRPPRVDLAAELRLQGLLHGAAGDGLLASAHDLSAGGLALCLAASAIAAGLGFKVSRPGGHEVLFAETPSRAVISCRAGAAAELVERARAEGVPAEVIGRVGGSLLDFGDFAVDMQDATAIFESALPSLLSDRLD